jgi:hypothetical protein
MLLAPKGAQFIELAGKPPSRDIAIDDAVGSEMPEVPTQFAPRGEHYGSM